MHIKHEVSFKYNADRGQATIKKIKYVDKQQNKNKKKLKQLKIESNTIHEDYEMDPVNKPPPYENYSDDNELDKQLEDQTIQQQNGCCLIV